jgi:hypothetical protein
VWADVAQPRSQILSPEEDHAVAPGDEVCFKGEASHGVPPYAFRWIDSEGELLGTGAEMCAPVHPLPPDETGHESDVVTVELVVRDAMGRTSHGFVDVTFATALDVDPPSGGAPVAMGTIRPHPVRASTTIPFVIPDGDAVHVRLGIYDVTGRLVRELVDGVRSPGVHQVAWDGRTADGRRTSSGVYYGRLDAGEVRVSRPIVVVN